MLQHLACYVPHKAASARKAAAALVMMSAPLFVGRMALGQSGAPSQFPVTDKKVPSFAVSSIKPNITNDGRWRLGPTSVGWSGMGVTVLQIIKEAYGISENSRIDGAAKWVATQRFDFEGKVDDTDTPILNKLDYDHRRVMLQEFLAERFHFSAHYETRILPIYALVIGKNGPKLRESVADPNGPGRSKGMGGLIRRGDPHLIVEGGTIANLAQHLSLTLGRTVVDSTGLAGRYDYDLDWTPDIEGILPTSSENEGTPASQISPGGPSIFTAVREQLGLELKSEKGPIEVLVIDHVEEPTPN